MLLNKDNLVGSWVLSELISHLEAALLGEGSCNSLNLAENEKLLISKFSGPGRLYPVVVTTIKTLN